MIPKEEIHAVAKIFMAMRLPRGKGVLCFEGRSISFQRALWDFEERFSLALIRCSLILSRGHLTIRVFNGEFEPLETLLRTCKVFRF